MKKMITNEDFWTGKLGVVREPKICACARRTGFAPKPVVIIFYASMICTVRIILQTVRILRS